MIRSKSQIFTAVAVAMVATMLPASAVASGVSTSSTRPARFAPHIPRDSRALGSLPDAQPLDFDVVLAPTHTAELQALLDEQRDPSSPLYGHYLARGQFAEQFGPSKQQIKAVTAWLRGTGLNDIAVDGFSVHVRTRAGPAGRALGLALERFRTPDDREIFAANDTPLIPTNVAAGISAIVGLNNAPAAQPRLDPTPAAPAAAAEPHADGLTACSGAANKANQTGFFTADVVGSLYGVGDLFDQGQTGAGQTIALLEFAPHRAADTTAYFNCFGLTSHLSTVIVDTGGTPDSGGSNGTLEANIDIEELATQAPDASIVSYEAPNTDPGALHVYQRIVNDDTAQAISISWGSCEPLTGTSSMNAISTLLAQAAAQGQTAVAASGDSGSEDCLAGNGSTALAVDSPASDPNITGAGGTTLTSPSNEPVWNDCSSTTACTNAGAAGGGLSAVYSRPSWQPLKTGSVCPNIATVTCRQVPDVSANAGHGEIFRSGSAWLGVGGTSIAAPKIAAIVADVGTACTARIGQLAPRLVTLAAGNGYGTALKDVTVGNNDLTRNHANQFPATTGNDLASGVGVPIAAGWSCPQITSISPTQAAPGASVTITGFALADATFTFGATTAVATARTATSATVTVPAGSQFVTVRGTNAIGSGIATAEFQYDGATPTTTTTSTSTTTTAPTTTTTTTTTTTLPAPTPTTQPPRTPPPAHPTPLHPNAYRTVASDGGIFDFGGATFYGSTGHIALRRPIVGMTSDPATGGYWFVASDGGIFGFHAPFLGSTGSIALTSPVVGMAATPDGKGYWLVTAGGRVFGFGNAPNFGSVAHPRAPIVGIAPTPAGKGYWLTGRDGSVYAFGSAHNYGSMFGTPLKQPVVGISADPATGGYWMVASDGGIFGFHAPFFGSTGAIHLNQPIVGITATRSGRGYWMIARDGGIFSFGNAKFSGSMGGSHLNRPMVGMAAAQ